MLTMLRMFAPIGLVNLARRVGDFGGHQKQVPPHLPVRRLHVRRRGHFGKRGPQILIDDLAADADDPREERGQDAGPTPADFQRQGLDHGDHQA